MATNISAGSQEESRSWQHPAAAERRAGLATGSLLDLLGINHQRAQERLQGRHCGHGQVMLV